jgi:GWxTD domain-containing protein
MDLGSLMLSHLTDASVRSLCLALVAVVALLAARVRSVSARHAVWTAVLGAMLLLPFLTPLLPPIPVPILRSAPVVVMPAPVPQPMVFRVPVARSATVSSARPTARPRLTWQQYGLALYLIVALVLLVRLLVSYLLVNRLVRSSGLVACDLLDEFAGPGAPALRESASIAVPMTAGWLRSSILLPMDWREWDREKLAAALIHELAHVRRKDALIALVAGINKAAFWFHPLSWWLERKLALLAEEASDDCALLVLGDRCRYASTLLEMTEAARNGRERIFWQAIAMARPSTLRRRIDRVLDESRRIHGGLSRGRWITLLLVSAVMLCGAAALQLQPMPPPPPNTAQRDARLRAELEAPYQKWLAGELAYAGSIEQSAAKPLSEEEKRSRDERLQRELESPYQKWLVEDVAYIITAEERAAFQQLSTGRQREDFIESFWLRRDPTPGTLTNEFKEEHYRRIAYSNDRFASKLPGWKTDRGRIYITFGPPDEIESHPSGALGPYEIWRYRWIEGFGNNVELRFEDQGQNGEYRLSQDPQSPNPPAAANSGATSDTFPMQVGAGYGPSNDGKVLAHITLTFSRKDFPAQTANDAEVPALNIYCSLTSLSRRRVAAFDDTVPLLAQPPGSAGNFTYHKSVSLPPADYRLSIVAKDLATGRTATRELTITVPGRE